ncbi:MAG: phospholipase D family protein [Vicinamibacterales bacterium]
MLARGVDRHICVCLPAIRDEAVKTPRLAAPRTIVSTPPRYNSSVSIELRPDRDGDGNSRPWHAKMFALKADRYAALMVGSSNFTTAGLGVGRRRNAEANLLTIVNYVESGRAARNSTWYGRRWRRLRIPSRLSGGQPA